MQGNADEICSMVGDEVENQQPLLLVMGYNHRLLPRLFT